MGWKLVCIVAVAALLGTWSVAAQETPTPTTVSPNQSASVEVTIGAYQVSVPSSEPVVLSPIAVETNINGKFVTYLVAIQKPSGEFIPLTACDDVAVICIPLTSPAKGQLRLADPGDLFIVTEQPT